MSPLTRPSVCRQTLEAACKRLGRVVPRQQKRKGLTELRYTPVNIVPINTCSTLLRYTRTSVWSRAVLIGRRRASRRVGGWRPEPPVPRRRSHPCRSNGAARSRSARPTGEDSATVPRWAGQSALLWWWWWTWRRWTSLTRFLVGCVGCCSRQDVDGNVDGDVEFTPNVSRTNATTAPMYHVPSSKSSQLPFTLSVAGRQLSAVWAWSRGETNQKCRDVEGERWDRQWVSTNDPGSEHNAGKLWSCGEWRIRHKWQKTC
ncbi:uncharacterized protein SPSK_10470 [Sporothrix schenckii 1099-18]|uniref:Uncharacterized protein n=1 Tax=Sporothrix schenckii 1099-18 TaxID=1397361 RepID=A0A0F2M987_SPOSC|nr:uncharacterized protein SPSK_10470 [Sporothrix schenckii 1099-18]KJR86268.1 hypothetical protein SPSK_10470 [Sporothrix schenckii 1099-18]